MINIGALLKLNKGPVGPAQLAELLKLAGLDASFETLPCPDRPAAFQRTARLAAGQGAQVLAIRGTDKKGGKIEALIVFQEKTLDKTETKAIA